MLHAHEQPNKYLHPKLQTLNSYSMLDTRSFKLALARTTELNPKAYTLQPKP